MKGKLNNPYWGRSEQERWQVYKKIYDKGFFLRRDVLLPQKPQVLVVDSSKILTDVLKRFTLRPAFGEAVDAANHVAEAFEKANKRKYDLIFSSVGLVGGGVDGLMEELATIPYEGMTLLLTSLLDEQTKDLLLYTGMDGFIQKLWGLPHFLEAMGWESDPRAQE